MFFFRGAESIPMDPWGFLGIDKNYKKLHGTSLIGFFGGKNPRRNYIIVVGKLT